MSRNKYKDIVISMLKLALNRSMLISKPPTMVKTAIIVIVLVKELGKSVLFWIIPS